MEPRGTSISLKKLLNNMESAVIFEDEVVSQHGVLPRKLHSSLLLGAWKEACRHIQITESTRTIAKALREFLPVGQVLVRRIEVSPARLETVAAGVPAPDYLLPDARSDYDDDQLQALKAWAREGGALHRGLGEPLHGVLSVVTPPGVTSDVIAGLLGSPDQPIGVLVVASTPRTPFTEEHVEIINDLLEPFAAALENDRRVRDLSALRAAAEADKNTLLTRLGRRELADVVVGADSGLKPVVERVELVARSDAPVLILGETGTGKEVIARLIHNKSPRANGPFMRVNCGAIPPELIDSQLFGHEKGAFTGAVESRQGWFERADGGTLLLDEVGELPLAAQVRLLRILQDGWLERVGGHQSSHVNVRIIAATHRDLASMAAEGSFREDLWYRIAVFPLRLPPLRERQQDVPALARHFAERAAQRYVLPTALPTQEDLHLLMTYPWPGNIRELGAVIDRAAILGNGRRLEIAQALGSTIVPQASSGTPSAAVPGAESNLARSAASAVISLDEAMKRHIERVLQITHGRIEGRRGTAALLKINPHTLRARMRKLGINWADYRLSEDEY